jgi:hypothetical protein
MEGGCDALILTGPTEQECMPPEQSTPHPPQGYIPEEYGRNLHRSIILPFRTDWRGSHRDYQYMLG